MFWNKETRETIGPIYPQPSPVSTRTTTTRFSKYACTLTITFVVSFSITYGLIWAIVHPQFPQFQINSISIPLVNTTNPGTLPTWEIHFLVRNPNNKMKLSYEPLDTTLYSSKYYSASTLCETIIPPFHQGTKKETILSVRFSYVQNSSISYIKGKLDHGMVNLYVELLGGIIPKPNPWIVGKKLKVGCIDVKVGFTNSSGMGSLLGETTTCKVEMVSD